jgi:hypothetical protein
MSKITLLSLKKAHINGFEDFFEHVEKLTIKCHYIK